MSPVSQPFAAATFQEPWSASAWDNLRLFSLHLVAIGGSGALARTALAPLERIKVLCPSRVDTVNKFTVKLILLH